MRLFDTFMLHDELDMLEARLTELQDVVHRFVLCESLRTHRNDPKPLHYLENRDRFAAWQDKIIHVVTGLEAGTPWGREHEQRDAMVPALADAADDDVVLISDVDEFPPARFLNPDPSWPGRQQLGADPAVAFLQRVCMWAVDWEDLPQVCSAAARAWYVREHGLAAVRDRRGRCPAVRGGWHLTWLGGTQAQAAKLAVTCHTEITGTAAGRIRDGTCYRQGTHYLGHTGLTPVEVDETWPRWIWERRCPPSWFRPRA